MSCIHHTERLQPTVVYSLPYASFRMSILTSGVSECGSNKNSVRRLIPIMKCAASISLTLLLLCFKISSRTGHDIGWALPYNIPYFTSPHPTTRNRMLSKKVCIRAELNFYTTSYPSIHELRTMPQQSNLRSIKERKRNGFQDHPSNKNSMPSLPKQHRVPKTHHCNSQERCFWRTVL